MVVVNQVDFVVVDFVVVDFVVVDFGVVIFAMRIHGMAKTAFLSDVVSYKMEIWFSVM